jgi:O-antigen/teichoic acid export membrane protein
MKASTRYLTNIHTHYLPRMRNLHFASAHLFVMFSTFLVMPLILNTYGVNYLGLFSLIMSINMIIPMLDLGYANSISTEIGRAEGYQTFLNHRDKLRSGFLVLPGIFIAIAAVLALYYVGTIYSSIEGTLSNSEIRVIILAMTAHAFMLLIFNVAYKIRLALNLYKLSSNILIVNSIVVFLCSACSIWLNSSFATFIITFLLSSWISNIFFLKGTIRSLLTEYDQRQVSSPDDKRPHKRPIPGNLTFFIAQISTIFAFQLDNFVVVRYLSLEDVAIYSTAIKFIAVPIAIFASYSLPLWTETSRGSFGADEVQIFRNLSRILKKRVIIIVPVAILVFFTLPHILKFWSSDKLQLSPQFTITLVLWLITAVICQPIAMVTNGMLFQKFIIISGVIGAFVNISISVILCKNFNLISGPVIGSIVAQIVSCLIPFVYFQGKITKHG